MGTIMQLFKIIWPYSTFHKYVESKKKKKNCVLLFGSYLLLFGCNLCLWSIISDGSLAVCMPLRLISKDLRSRIPVLFYEQGFNAKEICGFLASKNL